MWQYERDKEDNLVGAQFQQRVELLPSGGQREYERGFWKVDVTPSLEVSQIVLTLSFLLLPQSSYWFNSNSPTWGIISFKEEEAARGVVL